MFAVIDCNNFFVSCERVFNPAMEGRAVVVLSNNDGCVVSRSQEAKDIGIKMGMPAFKLAQDMGLKVISAHQASKKWNKEEVVAYSSNYVLYSDMSRRVMNVLEELVPNLEIYSIDESFVEFKGFTTEQLKAKAQEIVHKVKQYTGIPVCVGIGATKTLAKVANRFAKKYKGYRGYCIIDTEEKLSKALSLTAIEDVWGIGRRYSKMLKGEGIRTAHDFVTMSNHWVRAKMGVVGERTQLELKGTSANKLDHITDKKSITTSRSFGDMVESLEQLQEAVSSFASSCAAKLRQQNSVAQCITVYLLTNFFREDLPKYYNSITLRLPEATDGTLELVNEALKGLRAIYKKGYLYKKAGVIVTELMGSDCVQQNLFYSNDVTKINQINKVLDSVNAKYGRDTLKIAVQGGLLADQKDESWVMKRENLSRNFTTNISDIIECKI